MSSSSPSHGFPFTLLIIPLGLALHSLYLFSRYHPLLTLCFVFIPIGFINSSIVLMVSLSLSLSFLLAYQSLSSTHIPYHPYWLHGFPLISLSLSFLLAYHFIPFIFSVVIIPLGLTDVIILLFALVIITIRLPLHSLLTRYHPSLCSRYHPYRLPFALIPLHDHYLLTLELVINTICISLPLSFSLPLTLGFVSFPFPLFLSSRISNHSWLFILTMSSSPSRPLSSIVIHSAHT